MVVSVSVLCAGAPVRVYWMQYFQFYSHSQTHTNAHAMSTLQTICVCVCVFYSSLFIVVLKNDRVHNISQSRALCADDARFYLQKLHCNLRSRLMLFNLFELRARCGFTGGYDVSADDIHAIRTKRNDHNSQVACSS